MTRTSLHVAEGGEMGQFGLLGTLKAAASRPLSWKVAPTPGRSRADSWTPKECAVLSTQREETSPLQD